MSFRLFLQQTFDIYGNQWNIRSNPYRYQHIENSFLYRFIDGIFDIH